MEIYTIAKQVTQSCLTCSKVNKQASKKQLPGGRSSGLGPFQNVQVDHTKMPKVRRLRYHLVTVDHLTNCPMPLPIM
jgi:hypothetical protein